MVADLVEKLSVDVNHIVLGLGVGKPIAHQRLVQHLAVPLEHIAVLGIRR